MKLGFYICHVNHFFKCEQINVPLFYRWDCSEMMFALTVSFRLYYHISIGQLIMLFLLRTIKHNIKRIFFQDQLSLCHQPIRKVSRAWGDETNQSRVPGREAVCFKIISTTSLFKKKSFLLYFFSLSSSILYLEISMTEKKTLLSYFSHFYIIPSSLKLEWVTEKQTKHELSNAPILVLFSFFSPGGWARYKFLLCRLFPHQWASTCWDGHWSVE